MKVLAIICHPDDMELTCGGTLLKYKKAGHDVTVCNVANGNMGHYSIMPEELRAIRRKEAQKACDVAGFKSVTADIDDLTINSANMEHVRKLVRIIREEKPDLIITHHPNDYCSDHRETERLVFKASFDATVPHFMPEAGEAVDLAPLYYADCDWGVNMIPTEYVDITDEMDTKEKMMACHESQVVWLREHDGYDVIVEQRKQAAARGTQCGVKYAEGFTPCLASGRLRTYRLLP
ncbi:MAG: PIG-L family deacetylase [Clostridia bacterium]|nr:PIG-L family deacetylase [Clostridia bacterium]